MLREIRQLQHKNKHLEQQHKALLQKLARLEQFIETLKDDRRCTEVVDRLRRGDDLWSIAPWPGQSTTNNSKALSPVSEADLTAALEVHHRVPVDGLSVGRLSPGLKPTPTQEFIDEWQPACCPSSPSVNTHLDSPSEADDTEKQNCVPISSLLNSEPLNDCHMKNNPT